MSDDRWCPTLRHACRSTFRSTIEGWLPFILLLPSAPALQAGGWLQSGPLMLYDRGKMLEERLGR